MEGGDTLSEEVIVRRNETDVAWDPELSPKGRFECQYREMSRQFQAEPRPPRRHGYLPPMRPFEVDLVRIPPGKRPFPRHSHSVEWEYYIVVAGHGRMLQADGEAPIAMQPGDHLMQPPGWVHTIENDGDEDLLYYVIASNSADDTCFYPDSGKWAAADKVFRMAEADYYDGEE